MFLTHYHADHWLGLPGLLKTFDLRARERPLAIHGPPGLRELITLAMRVAGRVRFNLELVELGPGDVLPRDGYNIAPVPVAHRVSNALGYVLYEDPRPGEFDPDAATELGLVEVRNSASCSAERSCVECIRSRCWGHPVPGARSCCPGTPRRARPWPWPASDADLLVHEATFSEEEHDRAAETGHSTAAQAATLARHAGVTALALVHSSTRYPPGVLRDEARAIFPARCSRATSTRSRSRSPSAGSPS